MKAGFSSIDITPPVRIPIGGNIRDDSRSKGVNDPLKADIMILEGEGHTTILVDLDWVAADLEVIRNIKHAIAKESLVEYENICISMTHTHSGPAVHIVLTDDVKRYIDVATAKIVKGVKNALGDLKEVFIGWGKGQEYSISYNRRVKMKDGTIAMNWEFLGEGNRDISDIDRFEGPVDPEVNVMKICGNDGLLGVLVNFALHPAVLVGKDLLFSKDFIWGLEEELRRVYGENLFIYFANGAQGNINHIDIYNKNQGRDWNEAGRIGKVLGHSVEAIIDSIDIEAIDIMRVIYKTLEIPRRHISKQEVEKAEKIWNECRGVIPSLIDGVPDEWYAQDLLEMVKKNEIAEKVELQAIRIGNGVICTLPGEVFTDYGLELKRKSPFKYTVPFGITNQSVGYVPTPEAIINGGMEGKTCHFSRLAAEAGDMIIDELSSMICRLNGE